MDHYQKIADILKKKSSSLAEDERIIWNALTGLFRSYNEKIQIIGEIKRLWQVQDVKKLNEKIEVIRGTNRRLAELMGILLKIEIRDSQYVNDQIRKLILSQQDLKKNEQYITIYTNRLKNDFIEINSLLLRQNRCLRKGFSWALIGEIEHHGELMKLLDEDLVIENRLKEDFLNLVSARKKIFEGRAAVAGKIQMVPLSRQNIADALSLVNMVFPKQAWYEKASVALYSSLALEERSVSRFFYKPLLRTAGVTSLRYWVCIDTTINKVVGIIGLYTKKEDENEAYWGGWMCVHPGYRRKPFNGKSIIELMANHVGDIARRNGKKYIRLYTSNDPIEAQAQLMYEKMGAKIYKTEKQKNGVIIYFRQITL